MPSAGTRSDQHHRAKAVLGCKHILGVPPRLSAEAMKLSLHGGIARHWPTCRLQKWCAALALRQLRAMACNRAWLVADKADTCKVSERLRMLNVVTQIACHTSCRGLQAQASREEPHSLSPLGLMPVPQCICQVVACLTTAAAKKFEKTSQWCCKGSNQNSTSSKLQHCGAASSEHAQ